MLEQEAHPAGHAVIRYRDRSEWLSARREGIGGSDIAGILGVSPWASPWSVWISKIAPPLDEPTGDHLQWGHKLEPIALAEVASRTGLVVEPQNLSIWYSPLSDICIATPDGLIGPDGVVEVKAPRSFAGFGEDGAHIAAWGDGSDDICPPHYYLQCQWEMAATARAYCLLAVISWPSVRVIRIDRDDRVIASAIERAEAWWLRHIENGEPPEVDGSDAAARWLSERFPGLAGKPSRDATDDEAALIAEYARLTMVRDDADAARSLIGGRIRQAIGDGYRLASPAGSATLSLASSSERVAGLAAIKAARPDLLDALRDAGLINASTSIRSLRVTGAKNV